MQNQDSISVTGYSGVELDKCLGKGESRNETMKRLIFGKYNYFFCNIEKDYIVLISYFGENATGICIASYGKKGNRKIWIDYLYSEHKGHGTSLMKEMEIQIKNRFPINLKRPNIYIMSVANYVGFYESLGFIEIIIDDDEEGDPIYFLCKSLIGDIPCKENIITFEKSSIYEIICNGFNTKRPRLITPYFKPELINLLIKNWKDIPNLSEYLYALLRVKDDPDNNKMDIKRQRMREIMSVNIENEDLDELIYVFQEL